MQLNRLIDKVLLEVLRSGPSFFVQIFVISKCVSDWSKLWLWMSCRNCYLTVCRNSHTTLENRRSAGLSIFGLVVGDQLDIDSLLPISRLSEPGVGVRLPLGHPSNDLRFRFFLS